MGAGLGKVRAVWVLGVGCTSPGICSASTFLLS